MSIVKAIKTYKLKLMLNNNQHLELKTLFSEYTDAYNYLVETAIEYGVSSKYDLHNLLYHDIRKMYNLSADYTETCIAVAFESVKSWRSWCKKTKKTPKIPTSKMQSPRLTLKNLYSFTKNNQLSIRGIYGRIKCDFQCRQDILLPIDHKLGTGTLVYNKKHDKFYFHVTINYQVDLSKNLNNTLSLDMGVSYQCVGYNIVKNKFEIFHDSNLYLKDQHYTKLRQGLQSKGTRSATRRLKSIGGKQTRLRRDVDHCLSKSIIEYCKKYNLTNVVVEDLTNIRRVFPKYSKSKTTNRKIHMWAFHRLQSFIEYKAIDAGINFTKVNPANTSLTCPTCNTVNKSNRSTRDYFQCISCGTCGHADFIASYNISRRYFGVI